VRWFDFSELCSTAGAADYISLCRPNFRCIINGARPQLDANHLNEPRRIRDPQLTRVMNLANSLGAGGTKVPLDEFVLLILSASRKSSDGDEE